MSPACARMVVSTSCNWSRWVQATCPPAIQDHGAFNVRTAMERGGTMSLRREGIPRRREDGTRWVGRARA